MINKAFFDKYEVDLGESDGIKVLIKAAKKLLKECYSEENYPAAKLKFFETVEDFREATS